MISPTPLQLRLAAAERLGGRGLRVAGEHFKQGADFNGPAQADVLWLSDHSSGVHRKRGLVRGRS